METYLIGFIVCEYALITTTIKDWADKYPEKEMPTSHVIVCAIIVTITSLAWPIALAVWMRDLKGKLS